MLGWAVLRSAALAAPYLSLVGREIQCQFEDIILGNKSQRNWKLRTGNQRNIYSSQSCPLSVSSVSSLTLLSNVFCLLSSPAASLLLCSWSVFLFPSAPLFIPQWLQPGLPLFPFQPVNLSSSFFWSLVSLFPSLQCLLFIPSLGHLSSIFSSMPSLVFFRLL